MLIKDHAINGGTQQLYRYPNNFGASVVRHKYSYGAAAGLFELAVIEFDTEDSWDITYDTPITDDVIGHLTADEVNEILEQIAQL